MATKRSKSHTRKPRADAERNRDRVLEAAKEAFPCVKGGVKLDHWGGEKVDHFLGSWGFVLRDLRGRLGVGLRPALRGAFRPERKPALQIGSRQDGGVARSVAFRDAVACYLSTGNFPRSSPECGHDA